MKTKKSSKLIREGNYVAEVDIDLIYEENGWSPYISVEDAFRLDEVRDALKSDDLATASRIANIYTLTPVAV